MKILLALLIVSCFILAGCDDNKKVLPPNQEKSVETTQNTSQNTSQESKRASFYNERALDKSMPVSKEEMDTLIPTARALRLNAEQVKELVQALKQCGVNISDLKGPRSQGVSYKDTNRGGDRPENIDGVFLNIPKPTYFKGIGLMVSNGKGGISVHLKDIASGNSATLYWDRAIWSELKSYPGPSNEVVDKIYQYIKNDTKYGETINFTTFGSDTGTKEDIKNSLSYSILDSEPVAIFSIIIARTVKSEVYGGDNKRMFITYKFTRDGEFFSCNTSTDSYENGMMEDLERMKRMSK